MWPFSQKSVFTYRFIFWVLAAQLENSAAVRKTVKQKEKTLKDLKICSGIGR